MNAPLLLQPPPPAGTLARFAVATTELLGADSTATLPDHLRALAAIADAEVVLLYHGAAGAAAFELVASFGLPRGSAAALRDVDGKRPANASAAPDEEGGPLPPDPVDLGLRARWNGPLLEDGGRIGRLVLGSRRWDAFHPDLLPVFTAAAVQIAAVLQRRLVEEGDARTAASPDTAAAAGAEPLLFRRRRDRFIALLAHELRNPVAPIQTGLDLVATDRLDAAERQDTVRMMQRQVAQLAHLIDDFLDTARLNTGRLRAQRRPVPLLPALRTAVESIAPAVCVGGHRIERVGWNADSVRVDADPVRLTQAFANLLAAGVAAMPTPGTLTVRLQVGIDSATIDFEDEGPPIAEAGGGRLFDAIADASTSARDTALGLVADLVALNEGTVVAKNRDSGGGRVFSVTLPLLAPDAAKPAPIPTAPVTERHRILVVDDNRDAAESLGLLFRLDGHEVRLAHDGPGAVAAASEFAPELIVMDLGLPGFSGHEAIARIRGAAGPTRPGIVALTGWGTRADRDASARAGADLHLVKPVAQADLNAAIRRLLQSSELQHPA